MPESKTSKFMILKNLRQNRQFFGYLEYLILFYLSICIIWFSLNTIVPAVKYLYHTPFRSFDHFLQTAGIILLLVDWVLSHARPKGYCIFCLYGICGASVISSFFQRKYGIDSNLNSILWMMIIFSLFYNSVFHIKRKKIRIFITATYFSTLLIWFGTCCLSLVQFALQIGSEGPNHASTKWLGGPGFVNNRLHGLFGYPEYGAVTGLMLLIIGLYFIFTVRSTVIRVIISILIIPVFLYIVISGSRNAALAMYEISFIGSLLLLRKYKSHPRFLSGRRGFLISIFIALAFTLTIHCLYSMTKAVAKHVPGLFESQQADTFSAPSPRMYSLRFEKESVPVVLQPSNTEDENGQDEALLERQYFKNDLTTGRARIWRDYLSLYKEIGLFGLSPENASFYIQEHHPDKYIALYVKEIEPEKYAIGYVFHTHSGYLKVFVSAGFIGLAFLLIFIFSVSLRLFLYVQWSSGLSEKYIFALLVAIVGASSALFDNELFFSLNPTAFIFWISLAAALRQTFAGKQL